MSPHGFHNLASHTERVGTSRGRGSEMQREKEGCSGALGGSEFPAPSPAPTKERRPVPGGPRAGGKGGRGTKWPTRGQWGALVVLEGQEGCGSLGVCGGRWGSTWIHRGPVPIGTVGVRAGPWGERGHRRRGCGQETQRGALRRHILTARRCPAEDPQRSLLPCVSLGPPATSSPSISSCPTCPARNCIGN